MTIQFRCCCQVCANSQDMVEEDVIPVGWFALDYEGDRDEFIAHFCSLACLAAFVEVRLALQEDNKIGGKR